MPFLDRDVIDFALSIPDSFKLRDGISKEPVKRLASQRVGHAVVYRPKTGFGVPISEWFGSSLGIHMESLLETDRTRVDPYLDVSELKRRLRLGPRTVNEGFQLWVIYNLLTWWQEIVTQPRRVVA